MSSAKAGLAEITMGGGYGAVCIRASETVSVPSYLHARIGTLRPPLRWSWAARLQHRQNRRYSIPATTVIFGCAGHYARETIDRLTLPKRKWIARVLYFGGNSGNTGYRVVLKEVFLFPLLVPRWEQWEHAYYQWVAKRLIGLFPLGDVGGNKNSCLISTLYPVFPLFPPLRGI